MQLSETTRETVRADALEAGRPIGYRTPAYMARIDAHLATLGPAYERRAFLTAMLDGWQRAYAKFICNHGDGLDPPTGPDVPDASDYLLTICALSSRLVAERRP